MTPRPILALTLAALLAGCGGGTSFDQTMFDIGLASEPPPPPEPEPLPARVVAALPPGAPESTVFRSGDGCYLFSVEVTEPRTGYPVRDSAGNPICDGDVPPAVASAPEAPVVAPGADQVALQ
ncbi:hypothetical protein [Wenxinia saemankumensis]|uniref:Lipoprotein n=1 Tax=Wenxinia saemankumensis TaxID=1447782 RepID=A0A1M6EAQ1_9RHOB|nr:hypothetical protein [Wenxinia saemankumensis]SHI82449.1 hypothetical protein SAMN05444417_1901 [Wenxinia saemankumensis]